MLKIISLIAAAIAVSASGLAEVQERLTWEDIESGDLPASLEKKLNECIKDDIFARGIGRPCLNLMGEFQPSVSHSMGSWFGASDDIAFWANYWRARLNEAEQGLRTTYQTRGDEINNADALIDQLRETQQHWGAWKNAKCAFETAYDPRGPRSRWGLLEAPGCRMYLTAIRALELERMLASFSSY